MNSTCIDCNIKFLRDRTGTNDTYCPSCFEVRAEYSRVCTTCKKGLVPLEADDRVTICVDCSTQKYPCSTKGCLLTTGAEWKTLCINCFSKPKIMTEEKKCSNCPALLDAQWKTLCPPCYSSSNKQKLTVTGVKCSAPSCTTFIAQGYKKYCDPCYPAYAPSSPQKSKIPTATGAFSCKTPGCKETVDQSWKTMCISCFIASKKR